MKTELEIRDMKNTNNFNTLCRICLTGDITKSTFLFDAGGKMAICERIMLCTNVQIQNDESLPNKICENCNVELEGAYNFRIKCEYSDALLKRIVHNDNVTDVTGEQDIDDDDYFLIKCDDDSTNEIGALQSKINGKISNVCGSKLSGNEDEWDIKDEDNFSLKYDEVIANTSEDDDSANNDGALLYALDGNTDANVADICGIQSSNGDKDVQNSKRSIGGVKVKFSCNFCEKILSTKKSLKEHLASLHKDENTGCSIRMYQCSDCAYSTPRKKTLLFHTHVHTGEKPYTCDKCGRGFAQPSSLYSHMKSHSSEAPYACPECGKRFKHKFIYATHMKIHGDIEYTCGICSKGLRSRVRLNDHMNRHYNIKNFSCEICGSSFVSRAELNGHKKTHSGEKKFRCNECEYRCKVKRSLEIHMMRHSGRRAFKCETCELSCYTRGELNLHMRKHTKEKNYSCPVCRNKFTRSSGVNRHMLNTHGVQYKITGTADRRTIK